MRANEAYRHLLRYGRMAVGYKRPQTLILRNYLRAKFASTAYPPEETLANTMEFMKAAATWNGLERRCVATIIHVEHGKYLQTRNSRKAPVRESVRAAVQSNLYLYDETLQSLNSTMNLCL